MRIKYILAFLLLFVPISSATAAIENNKKLECISTSFWPLRAAIDDVNVLTGAIKSVCQKRGITVSNSAIEKYMSWGLKYNFELAGKLYGEDHIAEFEQHFKDGFALYSAYQNTLKEWVFSRRFYEIVNIKNYLNLRTGPSTKYPIIYHIPSGANKILGPLKCDRWCFVVYEKQEGWVDSRYLKPLPSFNDN